MSRIQWDPELFYPLDGAPRRKKFATVDIESKDGMSQKAGFTRPFLGGFYDGSVYKCFTDTNAGLPGDPLTRYFRPGGCVDRLMWCCLSPKRHGTTYYCHNGGGFDFLFFLPWLMKNLESNGLTMDLIPVGNSRLLSIHVRVKNQKWGGWTFLDSLRTLPMSLEAAGEAMELGGKLLGGSLLDQRGLDFTLDAEEDDPAWALYNKQDCVLLFDVLTKAHDIVENQFGGEMGMTAPSTAMKTFRRSFLPAPIRRDTFTHALVREGYFGGRTEWLEAEGSHLGDYDINSSYPNAMTKPMPMGGAEVWGDSEPPRRWLDERIGFCRVTVRVPEDIALPPLPVRGDGAFFAEDAGLDGKLLFPVGVLKGVWEWGELQNAIAEGCEILEWHESVWYLAGPMLGQFVAVLYKYRDKAHCFRCGGGLQRDYHCSKCQEPGYLAGLDAWAKLLLNSLYGKFGQRADRLAFWFHSDPAMPDGAVPLVAEDPNCPIWVSTSETDSPFIMPQVAARVTAIARVTLYQAARQAQKSVVRECWRCHSKVTYRGEKRGTGWVLGSKVGGSGTHGDPEAAVLGIPMIGPQGSVCPCGGAIETRSGRVYYMDTDSILTDAHLPTGKALGELKDEVPRFNGFVHGRFFANKMYSLTVEPSYLGVDERVRKAMMMRDGTYLRSVGLPLEARKKPEQWRKKGDKGPVGIDAALASPGEAEWWTVRSKGLSRKNRTPENLDSLYRGALARLEWASQPGNRYRDGSLKAMPEELENLGTIVDERLEQFGTLAGLLERDENGDVILTEGADGFSHVTSTPFARGPKLVKVPRRLHLEGAKRELLPSGKTRPHVVDMTRSRPRWWLDREKRRAELRENRSSKPAAAKRSKEAS